MAMEFEERLRDRDAWAVGDGCSAERVLGVISTKTAFLVIRECFYGTSRFEEFVSRIGASAPAVSRALKQLEAAGILVRVPYQEQGSRPRDEYHLTLAGEDLLPVFLSLMRWGDEHLQDGRPPLAFVESGTGRPVTVRVTAEPVAEAESEDIEVRVSSAGRHGSAPSGRPPSAGSCHA
ncbi:winged helix-turn-helix transcriptional regulator [Streptomyces boninensis]|uniref:winged helix-turn-helix transcriptional regulator n=1 Tax=Streptomyces boninensis TaxID=2039455 RepID=UPI003B22727B